MCDVSSAVDFGTFESAGLQLEFRERIGAGGDKCTLIITKA
jgi:hypothetical protein